MEERDSHDGLRELFARFVALAEADPSADFEPWVKQHAAQEQGLRKLYEGWRLSSRLMGEDGETTPFFFQPGEQKKRPAPGVAADETVDDYRLLRCLGRGGMGEVWEAEQLSLGGRRVALKFVRPERITPRQIELFRREARAGGRMSHTGIVGIHAYGERGDLAWIAMELVEGGRTVRDFLDDVSGLERLPDDYDRRVARFVAYIAEAIQVAHAAGVIHRDLKPQNILIGADERPKVSDFGLARITDESALSRTGEFAGTYFYMSPEQVAAKRAGMDHRTDIFSLGVLLYEMLTLERPFRGDDPHEIAAQILTKDPPDPRTLRSRVPADLALVCGKALEKDRDRRYATMTAFKEDLVHFLRGEPVRAVAPSALDRATKWVRRNPQLASVFGLAASLIVVLVSAAWLLMQSNAELRTERSRLQVGQDLLQLQQLVRETTELWPPTPERIHDYDSWQTRWDELAASVERASPTPALPAGSLERTVYAADSELAKEIWTHDTFKDLSAGLQRLGHAEYGLAGKGVAFGDPESENAWASTDYGWGIGRRREHALRLARGFAPGGEFRRAWEEQGPEVLGRGRYGDLRELPVQMGLVPIGLDGETQLWEFWHVASGECPERVDGVLEINESTGLVFVLLPGGPTWMGATRDSAARHFDPNAADDEGPVHAVDLAPFFVSRYEATQSQWARLSGQNPSIYPGLGPLTRPVDQLSWSEADRVLRRFGLRLPYEAEWEYAARGGTTSPWWFGDTLPQELVGMNVLDKTGAENGLGAGFEGNFDDGQFMPAPVDSLRANPFGLHHVLGNVSEWCADRFGEYAEFRVVGPNGQRDVPGPKKRVLRGGNADAPPEEARVSYRDMLMPHNQDWWVGVRPFRSVEMP